MSTALYFRTEKQDISLCKLLKCPGVAARRTNALMVVMSPTLTVSCYDGLVGTQCTPCCTSVFVLRILLSALVSAWNFLISKGVFISPFHEGCDGKRSSTFVSDNSTNSDAGRSTVGSDQMQAKASEYISPDDPFYDGSDYNHVHQISTPVSVVMTRVCQVTPVVDNGNENEICWKDRGSRVEAFY